MSVLLANHYCAVTGIDVEGPSVAFNVEQSSPEVGNNLMVEAGISSIELMTAETSTFLARNRETFDLIFFTFRL